MATLEASLRLLTVAEKQMFLKIAVVDNYSRMQFTE